jgi:uncharacterized damage-inducible protein DinB
MVRRCLTLRKEHNQCVNTKLYDVAAQLSEADYFADHGAFFGSAHKTLNHIVTTDMIWMHRADGTGKAPAGLDIVLHDTLDDTGATRKILGAQLTAWMKRLLPDRFGSRHDPATTSQSRPT